jgi:hypothetical protein
MILGAAGETPLLRAVRVHHVDVRGFMVKPVAGEHDSLPVRRPCRRTVAARELRQSPEVGAVGPNEIDVASILQGAGSRVGLVETSERDPVAVG